MKILIKTLHGLEEVLAKEIEALGGTDLEILTRAVRCEGDQRFVYRANYELRTAIRVLVPFATFKTKHENHFYKKMREIDWEDFFSLNQTFAINAVTQSQYLDHSQYLAQKGKDAICDHFRSFNNGLRPSVDKYNPDFQLSIHISRDNVCTLSTDSSGAPLYKRNYRVAKVEAPISEVLAAGMIQLSGWDGETTLIDPMCGSGTILTEAAMWAKRMPPQYHRNSFSFMSWKDFDQALWEDVRNKADAQMRDLKVPIIGYDKDLKSIQASKDNIIKAALKNDILIQRSFIEELELPEGEGTIIMNPPYDERLPLESISEFYRMVGKRMKTFKGYDAWVISSSVKALKQLAMRPEKQHDLFNGPLLCRYNQYRIFKERPAKVEE